MNISHRVRRKFRRLFHLKLFNALPVKFAWSAYGVWLRKYPQDATYRFCITGTYGWYLSDILQRQASEVFLDIGANQGLYSLIAKKNKAFTSIYAFEPNPKTYRYLEQNIARNGGKHVSAFPVGLSDKSAKMAA